MNAPPQTRGARLLRALHRLEDAFLALLLTAMIVLAALQIGLRNLFSYGIPWGEPLLRVLVLWLALLGAMAATRDDNHIRIDVLSRFLPATLKRLAGIITHLFAAAVCALLAWQGGRLVHMEWQDGLELFPGAPVWAFELVIPFGFGIMALRFLVQSAAGLRR